MPSISQCDNRAVPLAGVSVSAYPDEASHNLIGQTSVVLSVASSTAFPAKVTLLAGVKRSPRSGLLSFDYWVLSDAGDPAWYPPVHFAVRWTLFPGVKIDYADYLTETSGFSPASFNCGPTPGTFRFNFSPLRPAVSATRIMFVSTNARTWANNAGALASMTGNSTVLSFPPNNIPGPVGAG